MLISSNYTIPKTLFDLSGCYCKAFSGFRGIKHVTYTATYSHILQWIKLSTLAASGWVVANVCGRDWFFPEVQHGFQSRADKGSDQIFDIDGLQIPLKTEMTGSPGFHQVLLFFATFCLLLLEKTREVSCVKGNALLPEMFDADIYPIWIKLGHVWPRPRQTRPVTNMHLVSTCW